MLRLGGAGARRGEETMMLGLEVGDGSLVERQWLGFVWVLALGVQQAFSHSAGREWYSGGDGPHLQARGGKRISVGAERDYNRSVIVGSLIERVVIYDVHESLRYFKHRPSFLSDALKICIGSTAAAHVSSSSGGRRMHTSNEAR